jgi:hypothetical protein
METGNQCANIDKPHTICFMPQGATNMETTIIENIWVLTSYGEWQLSHRLVSVRRYTHIVWMAMVSSSSGERVI